MTVTMARRQVDDGDSYFTDSGEGLDKDILSMQRHVYVLRIRRRGGV